MTQIYDPDDVNVRANPHSLFAWLRANEPVHWSPKLASWIVTDYAIGSEVLGNFAHYSADRMTPFTKRVKPEQKDTVAEIVKWLSQWMVFRDPPDHQRLRRQVSGSINAKVFASLTESIIRVINYHLDELEPGEEFDFISRFCQTMPGYVVMDMLGVPRELFFETKGYANDLMLFIGGSRHIGDKYARARAGGVAMAKLFREALDRRRGQPPGDDVLGQLMSAEVDGRKMSDDELIGTMMMLLNGAHETTTNAIANTIVLLARDKNLTELLRSEPQLQTPAIEELLRYESPVLSVGRLATRDLEIGGRKIGEGNRIYVMLPAVNRDPAVFKNPDVIDVRRSPNPHMAFGKGHHFCLGAPLARLEVQLVVKCFLERFRSIEVLTPEADVTWHNSLVARGPVDLHVRLS